MSPPKTSWRVANASRTGTKHLSAGQTCQDFACFLTMPRLHPEAIVAAVADGLGSAPKGAAGAKTAAQAACAHASHLLWKWRRLPPSPDTIETILYDSLIHARLALDDAAFSNPKILQNHATTLLLLINMPPYVATALIGDCAAVISTTPGTYRTLAKPTRGEYANETVSVTSRRSLHSSQLTIVRCHDPVNEFALTTDGLLNVSFDMTTLEPHPPFFTKIGHWLRTTDEHPHAPLKAMLGAPLFTDRTDDDLTLLLAVRRQSP